MVWAKDIVQMSVVFALSDALLMGAMRKNFMTDETEKRLRATFDAASKKLKDSKPNDSGAEAEYAQAYRALVQAGLAMRIKKKYRS